MTSAMHLARFGFVLVSIFGPFGLPSNAAAQISDVPEVVETIDRGKLRLKLLMSLVKNERQAATIQQERLTSERDALTRERAEISALGDDRSPADELRFSQIEQRLGKISGEAATLEEKLASIIGEQEELQKRWNEANGIIPTAAESNAAERDKAEGEGAVVAPAASASTWLDGKRRVQEALVYLGGYNAVIDGDFGPQTRRAVRAYQARQSLEQTGFLTVEQEKALLDAAEAQRALYGVQSIEDSNMGYRLSYPKLLLSQVEVLSENERRFATMDGQGELIVTVIEDADEYPALFERAVAAYEVEYQRNRGSWFVVSGMIDDDREVYDTVRRDDGRLIRARLTYPADKRELWSPFAVIMFNTFQARPKG